MIDISLVDCAKVGDYVTIFGKEKITANYIAKISKTISYEVLTRLSERVKKVYKP
jgi:alanine racemase